MKKFSLFLSALLISAMSFAQVQVYELVPTSGTNNAYANACDVTVDGIVWNLTGNSTMDPWRIGGKSLTDQDRALYSKTAMPYNISKIEVTHGTAKDITVNSFKLIVSDEANGAGVEIPVTFAASSTTTIELPEGDYANKFFKFLYNVTVSVDKNKYIQFISAKFYAEVGADFVTPPTITGDVEFKNSTEVEITADEDLTVYYTTDGTEPTVESKKYTAPFEVNETTTVKAIAHDGENASEVATAVFKKMELVSCAEAAELCETNPEGKYIVRGYVTSIKTEYSEQYGNISFWMADTKDGGEVLQAYRAKPITDADKEVAVGDYVEITGELILYVYKETSTPEVNQGGQYTIIPTYNIVNDEATCEVNERMGRKTVSLSCTDETHGDISVQVANYIVDQEEQTVAGWIGDVEVAGVGTLAVTEEAYTLTATLVADAAIYNLVLTSPIAAEPQEYEIYINEGVNASKEVITEEEEGETYSYTNYVWSCETEDWAIELYAEIWPADEEFIVTGTINGVDVEGTATMYEEDGQTTLEATLTDYENVLYNVALVYNTPSTPSAVDNVTSTVAPVKVIENGNLIIIKNGVKFNATGAVVK